MADRSNIPRLLDIVDASEFIRNEMADLTLDAFEQDRRTRWSVERGIEIISEASRRLSADLKAWHPDIPWHTPMLKAIDAALPQLGLQVLPIPVRGPAEFEGAFATMTKGVGALFVGDNPVYLIHRNRLLALAAKHRLPTLFGLREFVPAGGLISYGPSLADVFRRAAGYVDKIRKGAQPADLPVDQPAKFDLVINLKTAKALGLTIPPSLLQPADEVIQ